jgi:hypothetical protein
MPANVEVIDDFYLLTQDNSIVTERQPAKRTEQFKTFIRNIGLPAPAVIGRKISAPPTIAVTSTMSAASGGSPAHKLTEPAPCPQPSTSTSKSSVVDTSNIRPQFADASSSGSSNNLSLADNSSVTSGPEAARDCAEERADFLILSQDEYTEHAAAIIQCKSSRTGQFVGSLDIDGVLKVWAMQPAPLTVASTMSKSTLTSLEWANKADRVLLLGTKDGNIRAFDIKEKKTIKDVVSDTSCSRIIAIASNPQGVQFTCSSVGRLRSTSPAADFNAPRVGKLSVWDLRTMKPEQHLTLSPGPIAVNSLVYNHNGQLLLTGAADGLLRLYDITSNKCIGQWGDSNTEVYTVSFSADETSCYSIGSDGKLSQWSIHKTGTKMADYQLHSGACGPFISIGAGGLKQAHCPRGKLFAIDSEGHHMLTCSAQGGLIYKLSNSVGGTLSPVLNLREHRAPAVTVDWSASVHSCLTGALDGRICVSTLLTTNSS